MKIYPISFFALQVRPLYFSYIVAIIGVFLFTISVSEVYAQTNSALIQNGNGYQWKDQQTIQQIVQEELTQTLEDLTLPGLTDWSNAMLEAYKSFLTFTRVGMAESHGEDMIVILDTAFNNMRTEDIEHPENRIMVMDDMHAKQVELVQKLTFN